MPIYEYVCSKCGLKFELLRSLSRAVEGASCPCCHESAQRVISAVTSFTKNDAGIAVPVSGTVPPCSSCGASSCNTCGL